MHDDGDWREDHERELDLTMTVGWLIRRWGELEELVTRQILRLQMVARARYFGVASRRPIHASDEQFSVRNRSDFHPPMPSDTKRRIKYLRLLGDLLFNESQQRQRLKSAHDELLRLYESRNSVAHGSLLLGPEGDIQAISHDRSARFNILREGRRAALWAQDGGEIQAKTEAHIKWVKSNWDSVSGIRRLSIDLLKKDVARMFELHREIESLFLEMPVDGPRAGPVCPPVRRAKSAG